MKSKWAEKLKIRLQNYKIKISEYLILLNFAYVALLLLINYYIKLHYKYNYFFYVREYLWDELHLMFIFLTQTTMKLLESIIFTGSTMNILMEALL